MNANDTSIEIQTEYRVASFKVEGLQKQIDRLNRKATKVGAAPILFAVDTSDVEVRKFGTAPAEYNVNFVKVTVVGESPKFAGWRLVARLIHEGGVVIIKAVPGEVVPEQYREGSKICEHCNTIRDRVDTFVVGHDDGSYKVVGSNCLADFLGHVDPHLLAAYAEILFELDGLAGAVDGDDFGEAGFRRGVTYLQLASFLPFVRAYSRLFGWVSAKQAQERETGSSAGEVLSLLTGRRLSETDKAALKKVLAEKSDEDVEWSQKAIDWAKGLDAESDFEHNLKAIATSGVASYRTFAIACAIIGGYRRHLEGVVVREQRSRETRHVGVVGERQVFDLFVISAREFESQFGTKTLFRLHDVDGNSFVWWSSGGTKLPEQKWVRVKGTVKKHGEYRGWKQTELSRCEYLPSDEEQQLIDGLSNEAKSLAVGVRLQALYFKTVQRDFPIRKSEAATTVEYYGDEDAVTPPFSELVEAGLLKARDDGKYIAGDFDYHVWAAIKPAKAKKAKALTAK